MMQKANGRANCKMPGAHNVLPESLLSRRRRKVMAWPQVPQVRIHIMLPDPISADTGMIFGLLHHKGSG